MTKGRNVQLPAVHVYSQRGARGAVFRDIAGLGRPSTSTLFV